MSIFTETFNMIILQKLQYIFVFLQSLGILASIPVGLLILSLFGLLLYLLTRCCDRKRRKPSTQRCQNCTLIIITLMCCAGIGLGKFPIWDGIHAITTNSVPYLQVYMEMMIFITVYCKHLIPENKS